VGIGQVWRANANDFGRPRSKLFEFVRRRTNLSELGRNNLGTPSAHQFVPVPANVALNTTRTCGIAVAIVRTMALLCSLARVLDVEQEPQCVVGFLRSLRLLDDGTPN